MKKLLTFIFAIFAIAFGVVSCETSGDLDDYTPPGFSDGSSEYAPVITTIKPGYERAVIEWKLNAEEGTEVEYCYLYTGSDVKEYKVSDVYDPATDLCRDTLSLAEGSYTLYLKSMDTDKNLTGAGQSVITYIYGESYVADLSDRVIIASSFSGDDCTIRFSETASPSIVGVKIRYTPSVVPEAYEPEEDDEQEVVDTTPADATTSTESTTESESQDDVAMLATRAELTNDDSWSDITDTTDSYEDGESTYVTELGTYDPESGVATIVIEDPTATTLTLPYFTEGDEITVVTTHLPSYEGAIDEISISTTKMISEGSWYVTVSSLEKLLPYLEEGVENLNLKMTPGVYVVDEEFITANFQLFDVVPTQYNYAVLLFAGSNNYYDFSGVTIELNDDVGDTVNSTLALAKLGFESGTDEYSSFGLADFYPLHTVGNNNVIYGLSMKDMGTRETVPYNGCVNIVMDGSNNRLENCYSFSTGSYPHGYGECFGKGSGSVISLKKHCAILVRGDYNHVKGCWIDHDAFGHQLFMQGAYRPTIEDCFIEGRMLSTNNIWDEQGTGSAADMVKFETTWGHTLPWNYVIATGEDGIRTYTAGSTYVDGYRFFDGGGSDGDEKTGEQRRTGCWWIDTGSTSTNDMVRPADTDPYAVYANSISNTDLLGVTVKNCIVKHCRGSLALVLGVGGRFVDGIKIIGGQNGVVQKGSNYNYVKDAYVDVEFSPAISMAYYNDSRISADITIVPYEGRQEYLDYGVGNASGHAAHIMGYYHNITLRTADDYSIDQDLDICLGGNINTIGDLFKGYETDDEGDAVLDSDGNIQYSTNDGNFDAFSEGSTLYNYTKFPVNVHRRSANNVIYSYKTSDMTVYGSNNTIYIYDNSVSIYISNERDSFTEHGMYVGWVTYDTYTTGTGNKIYYDSSNGPLNIEYGGTLSASDVELV
ncbi:MAG: DUF4998 domain-containing protein, partial [Rikenellaceae bacterium]